MSKKQKAQELLKKLKALEKPDFDNAPLDEVAEEIIARETQKVVRDVPILKIISRLSSELKKVKEMVNLEPLMKAVEAIAEDTTLRDETRENFRKVADSINTLKRSIEETSKGQDKLQSDLIGVVRKSVSDSETRLAEDFTKALKTLRSEFPKEFDNTENIKVIQKLEKDLRASIDSARLGGAPHRQINVSSSLMSRRYTDINFVSNTAIRWTASDDTTNKRVNITASLISGGAGGGTPGGNDTEIQFNNAGSFGGTSVFTWNQDSSIVALRGQFQLNGGTSGNVRVQAASVAGNWVFTLPPTDGSTNQVLTTDGNGITTWASVSGAAGSGITRTTSIITANTTGADAASTDYVYIAQAGLQFTLPTAVANNNLYTVKNFTTSSVLVVAPEGVDESPNALMIGFQSLNFNSNGSVWTIT